MLLGSKNILLLLIIAILILHIFLFIPTTIYLGNVDEFSVALGPILKLALVPALFSFIVLFIIGLLLKEKQQRFYICLLSALGILVWFQAYILNWNYGPLDGSNIDWDKGGWRGVVDLELWILVICTSLYLAATFRHKLMTHGAIAVFVVQLVASSSEVFTQWSDISQGKIKSDTTALDNIYQFSNEKNILHIVVDAFQSDVFEDLINFPQRGYRQHFEGFTYYPETLGVFPYTQFSVPAFLSAEIYKTQQTKDEFLDQVLAKKSIQGVAHNMGYQVDFAAPGGWLTKLYATTAHENIVDINTLWGLDPTFKATLTLLDLSLFRLAPHYLKSFIYNQQRWLLTALFQKEEQFQFKFFKHDFFLRKFIQNMKVSRQQPVYKYIHVMHTHRPMVVNEQCGYAGSTLRETRRNHTFQSQCTLDTLVDLMEKLKTLDIYDSSFIVIHSDHGGIVPNKRQGKPIVFASGKKAPGYVSSYASPLLMIKLPGAKGDLSVSPKQVSLINLPDSISEAMGLGESFGQQPITQIPENKDRERRFYWYFWQTNEWTADYTRPIHEFIINGSHYEQSWQAGEIYDPESPIPNPKDQISRLFNQAFRHQKSGKRELAIELYEQLLRLDPNHRQGTYNLAYAFLYSSEPSHWARSASLFQKVLVIDPQYLFSIHHLATAHWKLGNDTEGINYDRLYLEKGQHRNLRRRSQERLAKAGKTQTGSQ